MNDKTLTPQDAEKEFWKSLKQSNTGMLGLDRPGNHSQPMTGFGEEDTGTIWFFTRNDTDLARDIAGGAQSGMFTYQAKDEEVQACIHGSMTLEHDRERIDKYWNPVVAAWYPEGKEDPALTLIRFDGDDGRVWVSKKGPVGFGFEILKANLTKSQPDAGGVSDVNLG
ncbi:MAG: pyridoxamine 5'-phosphate oxidase family protein [Brevundimonas sp.]|uniref:pyridoxamine 5'-phosphate oxidase family protein n=1 Tax=Brevundimonas sp. TaxID=1871086 RepID=UPI00391B6897